MNRSALGRFPRAARSAAAALCTSLGLTLQACGPGAATPVPEPPTLELGRIGGAGDGATPASNPEGGREIYGAAGAAPPRSLVRATNLDRTTPVVVSNVAADGSFELGLAVLDGEEVRFDWVRGAERGAPQDAHFIVDQGAPFFHFESSQRLDCLQLTPEFVVDFGSSTLGSFAVANECSGDVSLQTPRFRLGLSDFELRTALPLTLAAHQSVTLELAFTRAQAGAREDTLFFDVVSGAQVIRYPITLLVPAVP